MTHSGANASTRAKETRRYIDALNSHLQQMIATGRADFGPDPNRMWMASLDVHTGRYPADDEHPPQVGKRAYRWIEAPRGSSLYWDQHLVVAAHALAQLTNQPELGQAADDYVRDFLARSIAGNGLFLWGNHYYYDAFAGQLVKFPGSNPPVPCDVASDPADYHEARPLTPAWDTFWRVDPEATRRCLEGLQLHLYDPQTGAFNRHADRRQGHAFLESGGVLVESFCYLAMRTNQEHWIDLAHRVARFNGLNRGEKTHLVRNCPDYDRWDMHCSTSEVGVWANSLLRAAKLSGSDELAQLARDGVAAYLRFGWDAAANRYFGKLRVEDGTPILGAKETIYQPADHADFWEPLFPTHDYPAALGEACVTLYQRYRDETFALGTARVVESLIASLPARNGRGGYAEHYGRGIHLLARAADVLDEPGWLESAHQLAEEAMRVLWTGRMFRTHPGEDRYDAVDALGLLALALVRLHTGRDAALMGTGF